MGVCGLTKQIKYDHLANLYAGEVRLDALRLPPAALEEPSLHQPDRLLIGRRHRRIHRRARVAQVVWIACRRGHLVVVVALIDVIRPEDSRLRLDVCLAES